ncbi:hypothetical protein OC845_005935 [Tilletia horrida]|nr:hypothetical protein OC845_005935 [Tilletia horrida]
MSAKASLPSTRINDSPDDGKLHADLEAGRESSLVPFAQQKVGTHLMPIPLILTSFSTGMLDLATFADFYAFASNQTGNCVVLWLGIFNPSPSHSSLISGVSLASFCGFALVFGQISQRLPNGPRTRWWLFTCNLIQSFLVLIVAILIATGVWRAQDDLRDAAKIVALLGGSGGIQVVNAKLSSVPEIPTAVVTSPWVELLSDRKLFSPHLLAKEVRSRNLRAMHIGALMVGALIAAILRKYTSTAPVIFLAAGLKFVTTCLFCILPGDA